MLFVLVTDQVPVSCRELMRSFGWDTADAFMQHDAQELETAWILFQASN